MGRLDEVDLSLALGRKEEERELSVAWQRLTQLRLTLGGLIGTQGLGPPVLVVFEGWDASGKGARSNASSPRSTRATSASSSSPRRPTTRSATTSSGASGRRCPAGAGWPSSIAPGTGGCWSSGSMAWPSSEQWLRAYDEINDFERSLADEGTIVVKLWLHISEAEQLRRFEQRAADPLKAWKLTDEDWANRAKRTEYEQAVEDMVDRTDRPHAPWHLIAAESKRYARVAVAAHGDRGDRSGNADLGPGAASRPLAVCFRYVRRAAATASFRPCRPRPSRRPTALSRSRILTLFLALIALASAFAACGGGGSDGPQAVVDEATLQGIESGDVDLSLGIDVKGGKKRHVDVSLSGPFQSESEAKLPELDLAATAKGSVGGEDVDFDGGFTLLGGNKAYVELRRHRVRSRPDHLQLRQIDAEETGRRTDSEVSACQEAVERS